MRNLGWTETKSKKVEANYHVMYQVSDAWKSAKLDKAAQDGYATVAFGLRVRTPLLNRVVLGNRSTPYEAEAEARSVANAFGQSYGLMNNRSGNEINTRARASKYRLHIRPTMQIHDACYYYIKDNLTVLTTFNKWAGDAFAWQDLPELDFKGVPLSGELDIFYPTWSSHVTLPNGSSEADIIKLITERKQ